MLTDTQKADVRRHLDYGTIGQGADGGSLQNYRFFQHHGLLEFRLNKLRPEEELILLGNGTPLTPVNPNFVDPATDVVHQGYLDICNFLEGQIAVATDSFDIKKAGSYESYSDETQKRKGLYNYWRVRMADFLLLPMNGTKFNQTSSKNIPLVN